MSRPGHWPTLVDDASGRVVAAVTCAIAIAQAVTGAWWLAALLFAGFLVRTALGPTASPTARLARAVRDRAGLRPRPTPAPPKRFAQSIGLALSGAAVVAIGLDAPTVGRTCCAAIAAAALLEAAFGLCIGCRIFAQLMRTGIIPESVCEACVAAPESPAGSR